MHKTIPIPPAARPDSERAQAERDAHPFRMRAIRIGNSLRHQWISWSLLAAGLLVAALAALYIKTGVERDARREFEYVCDAAGSRIVARLDAAGLILRSGAAFFDASESVTREEWRTFTRRLKMEQYLPGIQGIGFTLLISREHLARHIQAIRGDGFPDYQVRPVGERETYSSIIYLEPFSDRNLRAFGYDMLSEPVRRTAMERARDEHTAALSGKVLLVQETAQDVQPGTLLYFPVYHQGAPIETIEQRRAAIRGWVYSPYRMKDLIHGILEDWKEHPKSNRIALEIYDGDDLSSGSLLYSHPGDRDRTPDFAARLTGVLPIDFAGHRWTLRFAQSGGLAAADYGKAWLTLSGGMIISLLLFGLMRSLVHMRASARQLKEEITERKRADEEVEMAAVYLNTMPDALIVITPDATIVKVNQAFGELWGYSSEDVVGKPVLDFFPVEERPKHRKEMEAAIQEGTLRQFESRLLAKDGTSVPVALSGKVLMDKSGHVSALIAVIRDMTAHQRAEAEREKMLVSARQSRQALLSVLGDEKRTAAERARLAEAIEQSAETIMMTDAEGSIIYVNPAFETTTGYSRQEILGQNPRLLQSGKHDAEFYRQMWALLSAGETWSGHMINKRKDGTLYEEDASISPVLDAAGKIINYVAVKRDVTHQVQLEAQLQQAQKMESVGRLAGGVAHDFNNVLMGIMGYTELCRDTIESDHPIREYLDEIISGAQRSIEITRQLLAFARKQTIAPTILDLNDAVGGMLKLLRRMIGEDIKLTWRPSADLQPVKLDPSQVDQLLANLCVNARDAIAGVGEVTLETGSATVDAAFCARHPEAIPGEYVFLAVSDDGCGMDRETLENIFEPFFTTKPTGEGTGLGLATVYGIVKQNNGFIYATSEPGKGSTFRIYLPQAAATTAATTVTRKTEAPRGRGETILLAEDEKSLRVTCGLFLKALGYEVLSAETPAEALKLVDQHPGDLHLLLTDVIMPGMDGRQLAQRVGALKPGVKVVFMSGYTADVIAQRGVLDEGVQFLSKPFTRDDLARKMREMLGERE